MRFLGGQSTKTKNAERKNAKFKLFIPFILIGCNELCMPYLQIHIHRGYDYEFYDSETEEQANIVIDW